METPKILLFFANDETAYLRNLKEENTLVYNALAELDDSGTISVFREESATINEITSALGRRYNREKTVIFHYAGHAGNTMLKLEDQTGHAEGLANLLGLLSNLQLVFLNGCSTKGQVEQLLKENIPAVIATSVAIDDQTATEFASDFYKSLAGGATIQASFEYASGVVRFKKSFEKPIIQPVSRGVVTRDILYDNLEDLTNEFPWGLYYDKSKTKVLDYKLPSQIILPKKEQASKKGHVQYNIPTKMQQLIETECLVRIAFDKDMLTEELESDENAQYRNVKLSDRMQVKIIDPAPVSDPAFEIRSTSESMQIVDLDEFTEWSFFIKPKKLGKHKLQLKINVIRKIDGEQTTKEKTLREDVFITAEAIEIGELSSSFKKDKEAMYFPIPISMYKHSKKDDFTKDAKEGNKAPKKDNSATASSKVSFFKSAAMKVAASIILVVGILFFYLNKPLATNNPISSTLPTDKPEPPINPKPIEPEPPINPKPIEPEPPVNPKPVEPEPSVNLKSEHIIDTRNNQKYQYPYSKFGNHFWMTINLNYEAKNSVYYDNNKTESEKYGRLYTWETAKVACPKGWHLPTDMEWKALFKSIGGGYYDSNLDKSKVYGARFAQIFD